MSENNSSSNVNMSETPSIWIFAVYTQSWVCITANLAVFLTYMRFSARFTNPYYNTMKLTCLANIVLLFVIFLYSLRGSIFSSLFLMYIEECLGYSQIAGFNLINCVNRFVAIVFFYQYKTWVTHYRMKLALAFLVVWNIMISSFHTLTNYQYYAGYDYARTGTIMLVTNSLYWSSFVVSIMRFSSLAADVKKVGYNDMLLSNNRKLIRKIHYIL